MSFLISQASILETKLLTTLFTVFCRVYSSMTLFSLKTKLNLLGLSAAPDTNQFLLKTFVSLPEVISR